LRVPIIAGNWKMNKTIAEAVDLVEEIKVNKLKDGVEVVLCTPFTALAAVKEAVEGTAIRVGAQNMHWEEWGAYTGEISPLMLKELGVDYVIIGHSERRQYFNESDESVNKKVIAALKHGIKPIVCVGESLEERESNKEKDVVRRQITKALEGLKAEDVKNIVIAYEPIWAIGTGKTASAEEANDMIAYIREIIGELYGDLKDQIRIQYGGSVKANNIKELMAQSHIDGALVGGASLKAEDFVKLVNY